MKDSQAVDGLVKWAEDNKGAAPIDIIGKVVSVLGPDRLALASSFGAEDQVLTHMVRTNFPDIGIFTIDTGMLPAQTYDCMEETGRKYGFKYEVLLPDTEAVAKLVAEHGPELFYKSVDLRKECCRLRKVVPLGKKLALLDGWICGLRRSQAVTRGGISTIEWDGANGLVKVNPLAWWSDADVWDYIRKNGIPYNKLHDKGYPSIGCKPCTRAVKPGEDIRAGRWWWEPPEHKECGLHNRPGRKD